MFELNLPAFEYKMRNINGKNQVFDSLRRKYVALTPEEWVRQHVVHYLVTYMGYPSGRMVNEARIVLNGMVRRCDTVLYDQQLHPVMVMEYKAPTVLLNQTVFEQVAAYNWTLRADYLLVSNGLTHYCCRFDYSSQKVVFLEEIPPFDLLQTPNR